MPTLFNASDLAAIRRRVIDLSPHASRDWGKMDVGQMLAHTAHGLELACSHSTARQKLIGKLLSWMVRKKALGPIPFDRNMPTDKSFIMTGSHDVESERARLLNAMDGFATAGPTSAAQHEHLFFGRLTGDEWGILMWKHVDHHLRQFGG